MKILVKVLFVALCASLLFSCAKDEALLENEGDLLLKKASMTQVIEVMPTGVDDTENLKNALSNAGPGAVVQLCEGEYFIGFMEVRDFCGTLKGAGKGKTIITAMTNLDAQALWNLDLWHDLIKFVGGDVLLRDFTIQTPPGKVCLTGPPPGHLRSLMYFTVNNAIYEWGNENRTINVDIDQVHFRGQLMDGGVGYFAGHNCYFGLGCGWDNRNATDIPRERINIKITNSEIETFVYGLALSAMKNSNLVIGENNRGNFFHNNDQGGGIWEFRDTKILLEGNTFWNHSPGWGIDLDNYSWYGVLREELQTVASVINIQKNIFDMDNAYYGLFLRDHRRAVKPEENLPVVFHVKNNQFMFKDGRSKGIVCNRTKNTVIRNNKFSGYGFRGVQINSPGDVYNENGLLLGNNFSNFQYANSTVFLNSNTRNWSIVGGDLGETVIDLGQNNVITGMNVNTQDDPLGQDISDNLNQIKGPMHNLK